MQAVYQAILPVGHPLITFLGNHHDIMRAFDPNWQNYSTYVPGLRALKGVFHLQWLSLKLTRHFTQLDHNYPIVTFPDPADIVHYIQEQKQWEPILTDVFTTKYNLQAFLTLHRPNTMSVGTTSTAGMTSSASSVVSGLTTATPGTRPPGGSTPAGGNVRPAGSSGDRVENTHFNATLFGGYKTSATKTKTLRQKVTAGDLPPLPASRIDAAKPMCLAWHTKGQCNSLCPLTSDHVAYSAEEYAALSTWCREGYGSE